MYTRAWAGLLGAGSPGIGRHWPGPTGGSAGPGLKAIFTASANGAVAIACA